MAEQRMYSTLDGSRWFRLPTDLTFADGDLEVRDLLGRSRRWPAADLAPFEVGAEDAKRLSRQELVGWLGKAEGGIASLRAAMEQQQPGKGASLAGLQSVLETIGGRLRAAGDPAKPPVQPVDLKDELEGFLKGALKDPEKLDGLRQIAADLEAAAKRIKSR